MNKPYRRALGFHLVVNLLLAFSITLPIAAVLGHYRHSDTAEILGMWGMLSGAHALVTLVFLPSLATWLARKDEEVEAKRAMQSKMREDSKRNKA